MKKNKCILSFLAFFAILLGSFTGITFHKSNLMAAQAVPVQITAFEVKTIDGKIVSDQTLMAGSSYKIDFTLEIAVGIKDKGILMTSFLPFGDHYWTVLGQYQGIDTKNWQPGQPTLNFDTIQGTVSIELQGKVPDDFVQTTLTTGEVLHKSKAISLVKLALASGQVLDDRTLEVVDNAIQTYRSTLAEKQKLLADTKADPRYADLVKALIDTSSSLAKSGYTDLATNILKSIPNSGWIKQNSSSLVQWIIIGILLIILIPVVFFWMRIRGESAFAKKAADDQAKRLEILSSRVRGIGDSKLAGEIDKVKQELENISGR